MAVTKQTYTATGTWTASQLATALTDALTDAGFTIFDSFLLSSVENIIVEVTYDAGKTYGKTYYWFRVSTTGIYIELATGWTAGSDVPAGTQYLDFYATSGSSVSAAYQFVAAVATTDFTVTRYTSTGMSWFVLRQGSATNCFGIIPPAHTVRSWIDLNKVAFNGALRVVTGTNGASGTIVFRQMTNLRRMHTGGYLRGSTTSSDYKDLNAPAPSVRFAGLGNVSNSPSSNYVTAASSGTIVLPIGFNNNNPAYSADYSPVFHSLPYDLYVDGTLGTDFGINMYYPNNIMAVGDKLIVTAGVEEWEILSVANNNTIATGASPMFLARVI